VKIQDVISENARQHKVSLTEAKVKEIIKLFGKDLTEAQLNEMATGDFLKKLVTTAATAASLLGGAVAQGHEIPKNLQGLAQQTVAIQQHAQADRDRYKRITAKINDQRTVNNQYSLVLSDTIQGPANVQVFGYYSKDSFDPRPDMIPVMRCKIFVNPRYMDNLSDNAVAWVLGHEIAHCELGHGNPMDLGNRILVKDPNKKWNEEYDADLLGAKLARAAGYNPELAYKELEILKQHYPTINGIKKQSVTHPGYDDRMTNLSGGGRKQNTQGIMKNTNPPATQMKRNPDGSLTISEVDYRG
jgi:hypothetical protein